VELRAVLGESEAMLSDVLNWKVGTRILLNSTPDSPVEMRCGDRAMYIGRMGRRGGRMAVKIHSDAKPAESET
jgi:flagellar motor switch protein FliM